MDSDINNLNNFLISESKYENQLSPGEIDSRKKLINSINELNEIQTHLLDCINQQDEKIDNIETNILTTQPLVETGKNELIEAKKYYFTYTPIIIGTLIGASALSPIGLLLNLKLSGLFSLGGGILGGYTGYKIQK
tara:strand:- start:69 stop:476 length:408 start_codon:yes stop_codon:yes gene_type:complete